MSAQARGSSESALAALETSGGWSSSRDRGSSGRGSRSGGGVHEVNEGQSLLRAAVHGAHGKGGAADARDVSPREDWLGKILPPVLLEKTFHPPLASLGLAVDPDL